MTTTWYRKVEVPGIGLVDIWLDLGEDMEGVKEQIVAWHRFKKEAMDAEPA